MELLGDECRVLGTLVEKELTTPAGYPLTLNSLLAGCNQKSNRDPVTDLAEELAVQALAGLQQKQLVVYVQTLGSRVMKYKHSAEQALQIGVTELVILTELMLRGPQTASEIRARASRMHPLESPEVVQNTLKYMMDRPDPLVRELPPIPGTRATRYAQLLCPDLHPLGQIAAADASGAAPGLAVSSMTQRVEKLEQEVALLRQAVERLAKSLGEADVFTPASPTDPE